jgi:hypothetical protein
MFFDWTDATLNRIMSQCKLLFVKFVPSTISKLRQSNFVHMGMKRHSREPLQGRVLTRKVVVEDTNNVSHFAITIALDQFSMGYAACEVVRIAAGTWFGRQRDGCLLLPLLGHAPCI